MPSRPGSIRSSTIRSKVSAFTRKKPSSPVAETTTSWCSAPRPSFRAAATLASSSTTRMRTGSSPPDTMPRRPSSHSDLPELFLKSSSGSAPARPCSAATLVPPLGLALLVDGPWVGGRSREGKWRVGPRQPPCALRSVPDRALQPQPNQASREDDERLGDSPRSHQDDDRPERDQRRRHVDDRPAAEHEGRARDGAGGGRRHAVDERPHAAVVHGAPEVRRRDDDEEIAGQEHTERREGGAERAGHQVADEGHRDDDGSGGDHGHRDRIEELAFRQPVEGTDDAAIEERHDREPAPEDERPGLGKVPEDPREGAAVGGPVEAREQPDRDEPERGRGAAGEP